MNKTLLTIFFSLFESANLHDFVVFVHEDAKSMWNEILFYLAKALTPVMASFMLTICNQFVLNKYCLFNEKIFHILLQFKYEWFVFSSTVLNVLIHGTNISFYLFEYSHLFFYGSLFIRNNLSLLHNPSFVDCFFRFWSQR